MSVVILEIDTTLGFFTCMSMILAYFFGALPIKSIMTVKTKNKNFITILCLILPSRNVGKHRLRCPGLYTCGCRSLAFLGLPLGGFCSVVGTPGTSWGKPFGQRNMSAKTERTRPHGATVYTQPASYVSTLLFLKRLNPACLAITNLIAFPFTWTSLFSSVFLVSFFHFLLFFSFSIFLFFCGAREEY